MLLFRNVVCWRALRCGLHLRGGCWWYKDEGGLLATSGRCIGDGPGQPTDFGAHVVPRLCLAGGALRRLLFEPAAWLGIHTREFAAAACCASRAAPCPEALARGRTCDRGQMHCAEGARCHCRCPRLLCTYRHAPPGASCGRDVPTWPGAGRPPAHWLCCWAASVAWYSRP